MSDTPDDPVGLARVTVTRALIGDDVIDSVTAEAADGTELGLADALGMLALAQHTLVEAYSKRD